mgnify:CR=1 FL=1
MHRRLLPALCSAALLSGCASLPLPGTGNSLAFSAPPQAAQHSRAGFARGGIVLVPPKGFCIDRSGIRRTGSDGFAMMARCDAFGVRGFFGNRSPAVITATIGAQPEGAPVPAVADLTRLAGAENVREQRSDLLLPLVRLEGAAGALPGAAPVHWRGALVLDGHLLSVALYAPEGSAGLEDQGAMLLNDLARRTLDASMRAQPPALGGPSAAAAEGAPQAAPLRPRARPGPAAAQPASGSGWFRWLTAGFS